ncbi:MAG TPA: TIGR03085 family protein [Candidatus Corynebacterium avicola]|uniref:TIGR03085 family protein n=1 Tax=Candidatus Corynebacterium avicola TaxID=2838527 RepID=A0A9D1RSZ4_9CORY|nr:TIGR03085 family protein [Candidatus Corynebacterium avicola]
MTISRDEREALADLLLSRGPDEPTLCEGWTTRDMAVHLVLREHRLDATAGMFLKPFSGHLDKVSRDYEKKSYEDLVEVYRNGPPVWNPMKLADKFINLGENFVHHEDVRRGGGEHTPRDLPTATREALWTLVTQGARGMIRSSGATVKLVRTDGDGSVTVGSGEPEVTVSGDAGEIVLWVYGRDKAADVTVEGPVERVKRTSL